MPWGAAAAAAVVAGGYIQGQQAKSAAEQAAQQQREAGQQAAEMQKFRPVGITTGFGTSEFTQGPYGAESAKYTLTPEMQAIRDQLISQAGMEDTTRMRQAAQPLYGGAQQLFGLGQQYLSTSPEQARADYIRTQQASLAPSREQQLAGVRNQVFQTGRGGLATGGTSTGMQQTNPEMAAYYNAIAQQDLQLATQAENAAQQRQAYGAGLFGTAGSLLGQVTPLTVQGYAPLQTQLGLAGSIEEMGQQSLGLGLQVGGQNASAGANAGRSLLTSGISAAQTQQAANAWSPWGTALSAAGNSYFGGGGQMPGGANTYNTASNNWFTSPTSGGTFSGSQFQLPQR
jgi:hypothetical protein